MKHLKLVLLPNFCMCLALLIFIYSPDISFAQLPDCDIWVLDIKDSAGKILFSNPQNITNRVGYDNQPSFSSDGSFFLFSSQSDTLHQTDIYKYDFKNKKIDQVTHTAAAEYSPIMLPDGKNISVVKEEINSPQQLWSYSLLSGDSKCLMNNVDSMGYYCWINKDSVALFILSKPSFTLQIFDINLQTPSIIADSIGRCMRMRNGKLWFTSQSGHVQNLFELEFRYKNHKPNFQITPQGFLESEDYCFYGKNEIWSFSNNSIVAGNIKDKTYKNELVNLEVFGITKPTRLVVSADRKKLAVVSNK